MFNVENIKDFGESLHNIPCSRPNVLIKQLAKQTSTPEGMVAPMLYLSKLHANNVIQHSNDALFDRPDVVDLLEQVDSYMPQGIIHTDYLSNVMKAYYDSEKQKLCVSFLRDTYLGIISEQAYECYRTLLKLDISYLVWKDMFVEVTFALYESHLLGEYLLTRYVLKYVEQAPKPTRLNWLMGWFTYITLSSDSALMYTLCYTVLAVFIGELVHPSTMSAVLLTVLVVVSLSLTAVQLIQFSRQCSGRR